MRFKLKPDNVFFQLEEADVDEDQPRGCAANGPATEAAVLLPGLRERGAKLGQDLGRVRAAADRRGQEPEAEAGEEDSRKQPAPEKAGTDSGRGGRAGIDRARNDQIR